MRRIVYTLLIIIAIILIVGIALIISNTIAPNPNPSSGNLKDSIQKITVSEVTHSVFYAPQYAAINLGFFKEEGLDIELLNGGGADKVMTAVLSNDVEIGFAGPEASIYVYNEGSSDYTQVFAQVTKRDGSFLISRVKENNFQWENLKNKHILPGRKGGVPYMTLQYVLKKHGLNIDTDLNFDNSISFDAMTGAFLSGTADYVTVFEPTATNIELEGKGYIVASVGEAAEEIPFTAYFAKKSYIENHPDIIQKFVNAIYKGQTWVQTHSSEEIANAVLSSFPDTDIQVLIKVIDRYKQIDAWNTTPFMTEDSFNRLQTVMTEAGELVQTAPYDKIVNNTFIKN
ncbi:MAG: ABC transporter substrate-binding protein [Clostridia bacterium]|nr:ABC transporter substrate-binding protein [Clostridia bacterium]